MGAQPTGTITLLFSDIEGSTRLLHVLGADRYARVLERHRIILRDAFGRHGGYEVDCEGDAFFVAFASAADAVAAASEGQLALAAEAWPEGVELRVRIGLHTGEPLVAAPKYVGVDVHRAARIMAAGHGGQVLLSQSTRDLLGPDLAVRDLGEQRLKDLLQPERLYQLQLAGLASEFPPLRSLNATNLPVASWPLVGRREELAEIGELLRDGARLVTLTGPGGSGKTRLALQVAAESVDDFPDGVFFVGLAPLRSAELVPGEIADALGIGPTSEPLELLHEHLAERQMLLVLDNAEHLPGLAAILARFSETRRLRLLVTSRRPLHLSWERAYRVDPLPEQDAIEFFVQRARAVRRDFAADTALPELCRRLDGLPLALELAAARVKLLSPQAILDRLDTVLPFLSAGPQDLPERQRTLRATIEWSHDLLDEAERAAFRRLSVFPGTYALGAAEAVADTDLELLAALVDHSLLKPVGNDRLLMLETLREYAAELLRESGEEEELARRHAGYFTEIAESALAEPFVPDAATWLARLEADLDKFRAALAFARDSGDGELFLRLAAAVGRCYWTQRGDLREGRDWLEQALAAGETPEEARIVALIRSHRSATNSVTPTLRGVTRRRVWNSREPGAISWGSFTASGASASMPRSEAASMKLARSSRKAPTTRAGRDPTGGWRSPQASSRRSCSSAASSSRRSSSQPRQPGSPIRQATNITRACGSEMPRPPRFGSAGSSSPPTSSATSSISRSRCRQAADSSSRHSRSRQRERPR